MINEPIHNRLIHFLLNNLGPSVDNEFLQGRYDGFPVAIKVAGNADGGGKEAIEIPR
jgi:hypothetical protein